MYNVIIKNSKKIASDSTLHPGELLGEELEAREIRQKEFAEIIGMRVPHLNELIKGKRHISALLAIKLENELGLSAAFWLRLQVDYDLKMARKQKSRFVTNFS